MLKGLCKRVGNKKIIFTIMNYSDLNAMGVSEMTQVEMKQVEGGIRWKYWFDKFSSIMFY
jgi:hypothetical protein